MQLVPVIISLVTIFLLWRYFIWRWEQTNRFNSKVAAKVREAATNDFQSGRYDAWLATLGGDPNWERFLKGDWRYEIMNRVEPGQVFRETFWSLKKEPDPRDFWDDLSFMTKGAFNEEERPLPPRVFN